MDFVRSHFGKMNLRPVEHFFEHICHHFWVGLLLHPVHNVSFDWFLSSLEWILNFEICLLKVLIFYQKLLWNIRSSLNSSSFWVFEHLFRYIWSKLELFVQTVRFWSNISNHRLKNSKCEKVKPRFDIL